MFNNTELLEKIDIIVFSFLKQSKQMQDVTGKSGCLLFS